MTHILMQYWIIAICSFCSAIPAALVGTTMQAWLSKENIEIQHIGLFALVGLPYSFKCLWAPLLDHYEVIFLGKRRGWLIITSTLCALYIIALSALQPTHNFWSMAMLCIIITTLSASFDVVLYAYKIETLTDEQRPIGFAIGNTGYRLGTIIATAFALICIKFTSWQNTYRLLGSLMLMASLTCLCCMKKLPINRVKEFNFSTYISPFLDLFHRKSFWSVLGFIVFYKLEIIIAVAFTTPFLFDLGYSELEVANVSKAAGIGFFLVGSFLGAFILKRTNLYFCLLMFKCLQILAVGTLITLAYIPHSKPLMAFAISFENFVSGLSSAAYSVYLTFICNKQFALTQFALLTSLVSLTRKLISVPGGWIIKWFGWPTYFVGACLLSLPGFIYLLRKKAKSKLALSSHQNSAM